MVYDHVDVTGCGWRGSYGQGKKVPPRPQRRRRRGVSKVDAAFCCVLLGSRGVTRSLAMVMGGWLFPTAVHLSAGCGTSKGRGAGQRGWL